jgi:hypothetical protein
MNLENWRIAMKMQSAQDLVIENLHHRECRDGTVET